MKTKIANRKVVVKPANTYEDGWDDGFLNSMHLIHNGESQHYILYYLLIQWWDSSKSDKARAFEVFDKGEFSELRGYLMGANRLDILHDLSLYEILM